MDLISKLPRETLWKIFEHLDGNQLAKCSSVCRRFYDAVEDDIHWKNLCEFDWLIFELPNNIPTWKQCYIEMYRRYGRYVKCYRRVIRCWEKIFAVTQQRCPPIYNSLLRDGTSEESLDKLQKMIGIHAKLPLEYRCSYRLCNGQENFRPVDAVASFAGLFGSYDVVDRGDYMRRCPDDEQTVKSAIFRRCCLSFVFVTERVHLLKVRWALCVRDSTASEARRNCEHDAEHENLDGRVVSVSDVDSQRVELFIRGNTFIDFLEDFANRICDFPAVNSHFLKSDFNAAEETGPFTVTVRGAFFRDGSRAFPVAERWFRLFYHITIKMRPDAPQGDSCQLVMHHLAMTDANGKVETMNGPGVVSDYPVLRPGAKYGWLFGTGLATTVGKVRGYFTMTKLNDGSEIRINCPEVVMVAPEFAEIS